MKNNKQNEELQSRREFFKSAAKAALPIIGAAVLASTPVLSKAAEVTGCLNDGCTGTCTACTGTCKGFCNITCEAICKDSCNNNCRGGCRDNCARGNY